MYMDTDDIEQELGVMQLSDSFFPAGIFATSSGIEFLFSKKKIRDANELAEIIKSSITQQVGPMDCVALSAVFDSAERGNFDEVSETDNVVFASKLIKETRESSVRSGIQTAKCVAEFATDDRMLNQYMESLEKKMIHGVFPVAFAICCNALKIKKEKSMSMMVYGFVVGVVGAALRLGMIQHFEGQKIIHQTKPIIAEVVREYSCSKSVSRMWQFAPQMDIVQMSHEKMDSKMFIT